jgi:hypothetical protein
MRRLTHEPDNMRGRICALVLERLTLRRATLLSVGVLAGVDEDQTLVRFHNTASPRHVIHVHSNALQGIGEAYQRF